MIGTRAHRAARRLRTAIRDYFRGIGERIQEIWAGRDRSRPAIRLRQSYTLFFAGVSEAMAWGFPAAWFGIFLACVAVGGLITAMLDLRGSDGRSEAAALARIFARYGWLVDAELRAAIERAGRHAAREGSSRVSAVHLARALAKVEALATDERPRRVRLDRSARRLIREAVAIATWEGRDRAGTADALAALTRLAIHSENGPWARSRGHQP